MARTRMRKVTTELSPDTYQYLREVMNTLNKESESEAARFCIEMSRLLWSGSKKFYEHEVEKREDGDGDAFPPE